MRSAGSPARDPGRHAHPRTDWCRDKTTSGRGEPIDLWYCGKVCAHGGNVQAVLALDGFPRWVSQAEPGLVYDTTAVRLHALPPGTGYGGASPANRIPVK